MSERSDNIRFYLWSKEFGKKKIDEIKDYSNVPADKYELQDGGYFAVTKVAKVTLYQLGYDYLYSLFLSYGPSIEVRLLTEVKDDNSMAEDWKLISDPRINMYTLVFGEDTDNRSVDCELIQGGDLKLFEESFDDEYDVVAVDAPELPYVNLRLDPRAILKRSRFKGSDFEVEVIRDVGDTAKAVPLDLDYSSERQYVGEVSNFFANSNNNNYAKLTTAGNCFITNAPRDLRYVLNGKIRINVTQPSFSGSYLRMDLVRYVNGSDTDFGGIIQAFGSIDPSAGGISTSYIEYTFNDYELIVNQGDSIGIMVLTDAGGGPVDLNLKFRTSEDTDFNLVTETPYPATYTKAVKPFDMFRHLARLVTEDPDYNFISSVFGVGKRHETKLLVHGTWLRNMPQVLNEGEGDERRIQANLSLEKLFEAYSILEPLRYDAIMHNGKKTFTVGSFKDIRQKFRALDIGDENGEGAFEFFPAQARSRNVLSDNHYRTVKLGSNTSGSNYGAVNNLYSVCGNAEWKTPHKDSQGTYERTTDFRTGAEDVEIQRQFQYTDNPDIDGDYDNDWFLIDAEWNGVEYVVKGWQSYYAEAPQKVYSVDTMYNWCFIPTELLRGHGYKVTVGIKPDKDPYLSTPKGNCSLSVVTRRAGESTITANEKFPVSFLGSPLIMPFMLKFQTPYSLSVAEKLRGHTNGVDNKFGLVRVLYDGNLLKGYLYSAEMGSISKYQVILSTI